MKIYYAPTVIVSLCDVGIKCSAPFNQKNINYSKPRSNYHYCYFSQLLCFNKMDTFSLFWDWCPCLLFTLSETRRVEGARERRGITLPWGDKALEKFFLLKNCLFLWRILWAYFPMVSLYLYYHIHEGIFFSSSPQKPDGIPGYKTYASISDPQRVAYSHASPLLAVRNVSKL